MSISKEHFASWKREEVTAALFKHLQHVKDRINEALMDDAVVDDPDCRVAMAKLIGERMVLSDLLELSSEDLEEEEENV